MVELPLEGLLEQGAKTLSSEEFSYLKDKLLHGLQAKLDGTDCWFEYVLVKQDAA